MAVARHFGWSAVSGPHAMDWRAYQAARQYLAEEFVGSRLREARRAEDAQAAAVRSAAREPR